MELTEPLFTLYFPPGQLTQLALPDAAWYRPGEQYWHTSGVTAPVLIVYMPAAQEMHLEAPVPS